MDELLKSLPAEALFGLGAVIGIGVLVRYFGLGQGQRASPEHSAASAQVAAVIVDPSALNKATAAIEAQTLEAIHFRKSTERAVDDFGDRIRDLTRSIDAMREEMIRKGR